MNVSEPRPVSDEQAENWRVGYDPTDYPWTNRASLDAQNIQALLADREWANAQLRAAQEERSGILQQLLDRHTQAEADLRTIKATLESWKTRCARAENGEARAEASNAALRGALERIAQEDTGYEGEWEAGSYADHLREFAQTALARLRGGTDE